MTDRRAADNLHMAQKDIPEKVIKEDSIKAELNTKFELYDSIFKAKLTDLNSIT
jgi:hypothetical protein